MNVKARLMAGFRGLVNVAFLSMVIPERSKVTSGVSPSPKVCRVSATDTYMVSPGATYNISGFCALTKDAKPRKLKKRMETTDLFIWPADQGLVPCIGSANIFI